MEQRLRTSLQISTFYYFLIILTITTISQLTTLTLILLADVAGKELVIAATIVASAFFGSFGIIRIMTNLSFIMREMDKETAATNWGKEMQSIPLHILRFVFAGVIIIVAIIQLITLYS